MNMPIIHYTIQQETVDALYETLNENEPISLIDFIFIQSLFVDTINLFRWYGSSSFITQKSSVDSGYRNFAYINHLISFFSNPIIRKYISRDEMNCMIERYRNKNILELISVKGKRYLRFTDSISSLFDMFLDRNI